MCDGDDFDSPRFDRREWRKAQKEHACYACSEKIRAGDSYHHTSLMGYSDDRPNVFKHCARCWMICEALWAAGANGIDFGLNCGETWADNVMLENPEPAALAFLTQDEAQRLHARLRAYIERVNIKRAFYAADGNRPYEAIS